MSTTEFRSRQVLDIFHGDISESQLQWWDERKLVVPRMVGHCRVYSSEDILDIALVTELRRKGISIQQIRAVVKSLRKAQVSKRLNINYDLLLLTNGKVIFIEADHTKAMDLLKSASIPLSVVSLSDCWRRVRAVKP